MSSEKNWVQRVWKHMVTQRRQPIDSTQEYIVERATSEGGIKILYVGKDTSINSERCNQHSGSRDGRCGGLLPYNPDPFVPKDAVPYLDDSDEIQIAAHIARRQSRRWRNERLINLFNPSRRRDTFHLSTSTASLC
ncbi:hypothetical protein COEREDRAFT_12382 [Coemansia reversa NRRL 1564]|uniref:Uncharacterized protein n=1 Tax=Coemansia reversa (strain ATCC 12441 / NRRL 1564) TaxID=763665 RepID=A0A2G5B0Z4_COERN|nr:hypothetical protein COEREDRAFT_12382 [Coemansia reversa NRRL 1564]|eukprot:PIA12674.1 hypothetical protein COEREDRAFT_12382 [Coemansia reversa NRRL 1564]